MENRSEFYKTEERLNKIIEFLGDQMFVFETIQIIQLFEERGWGLYKAVDDCGYMSNLVEIIKNGRAWGELEENVRYIPLPLAEPGKDNSPEYVLWLIDKMFSAERGPYFADVVKRKLFDHCDVTFVRAAWWVDSVILTDSGLSFIVDYRLSKVFAQTDRNLGCELSLGLNYKEAIARQFTRSFSFRTKTKDFHC